MSNEKLKEFRTIRAHSLAGESLASYLLELPFRNVCIPDIEKGLNRELDKIEDKTKIEKFAITLIFGAIAKAKHETNIIEYNRTSIELDSVIELLSNLCNSDKEAQAYLDLLIVRAVDLWNSDDTKTHNWEIVKQIAVLLLSGKILTIYDIENVYKDNQKKA